jgi:hypothetical protein
LAPFRSTPKPTSLDATIVPALIAAGWVRPFDDGTRYFLDFGTPAGLKQLQRDQLVFSHIERRLDVRRMVTKDGDE